MNASKLRVMCGMHYVSGALPWLATERRGYTRKLGVWSGPCSIASFHDWMRGYEVRFMEVGTHALGVMQLHWHFNVFSGVFSYVAGFFEFLDSQTSDYRLV